MREEIPTHADQGWVTTLETLCGSTCSIVSTEKYQAAYNIYQCTAGIYWLNLVCK